MVSESTVKKIEKDKVRAEKRRLARVKRDEKKRLQNTTPTQKKDAKATYDKRRNKVKKKETKRERSCSITDDKLAWAKNQTDGGRSLASIAKDLDVFKKPLKDRLMNTDFQTNEMKALTKALRDTEIDRLMILGQKAQHVLNDDVDKILKGEKEMKNPIPYIAMMDRSFQQRRLLEGESTDNIKIFEQVMVKYIKD